jgi:type I restriction enzyme R subunit
VNRRFSQWLAEQEKAGRRFTPTQRQWLEMIKEHIAASASIRIEDFEYTPFSQKGGVVKANDVFERELDKVLEEMNKVLVA